MCLNFGHLKIINFPFGTNGKLIVLGVPILKHITVLLDRTDLFRFEEGPLQTWTIQKIKHTFNTKPQTCIIPSQHFNANS